MKSLALVLSFFILTNCYAQKRASTEEVLDDVPHAIDAEDSAIQKRGKAQMQARKAVSQALLSGNRPVTDQCEKTTSLICITGSGSIVVMPGANINGPIINSSVIKN